MVVAAPDLANIDVATVLASLGGSGALVFLAGRYLVGKGVDHALAVRLADHQAALARAADTAKAVLEAEAEQAKARLDADLKRQVENDLGEAAAERSYNFDARKRLYAAIGPLRFQLVVAAVQYRARVISIAEHSYATRITDYFGRSVLYRLMRVLTLTELLERQIAYADFSVDTSTLRLLRFREAVLRALSSADVVLDHPAADWDDEVQHLFRDTLPVLAAAMVVTTLAGERVMRVDEFKAHLTDPAAPGFLEPLAGIVDRFDLQTSPLFWLRLVALGEVCGGLIAGDPIAAALERVPANGPTLLQATHDSYVRVHLARYANMLADFRGGCGLATASSAL